MAALTAAGRPLALVLVAPGREWSLTELAGKISAPLSSARRETTGTGCRPVRWPRGVLGRRGKGSARVPASAGVAVLLAASRPDWVPQSPRWMSHNLCYDDDGM